MSTDHEEARHLLKGALEAEEKAAAHSPPHKAILQNARRLLYDAVLLYANGRFASATALAILAIEEKGKYLIAKWAMEEGSVAKDLNDHIVKQVKFSSIVFSDTSLSRLGQAGFQIKHRTELTEGQKEWADQSQDCVRQLFVEVLRQTYESEAGIFIARARQREINKTKQNCMYVDVDSCLEVIADPANILSKDGTTFHWYTCPTFLGEHASSSARLRGAR